MQTAKFNHICWAVHLFRNEEDDDGDDDGIRQPLLKSNGFWQSSNLIKRLVISAPAQTHTHIYIFWEQRQPLICRGGGVSTFGPGVRTCSTLTLNFAAAVQTGVYEQMLWDIWPPNKSPCALQKQQQQIEQWQPDSFQQYSCSMKIMLGNSINSWSRMYNTELGHYTAKE